MNLQRDREISILSFWHKLEFFSPFDAKQRITEAQDNNRYCSFSINELKKLPQDQSIRNLFPQAPLGKQFNGASIYLNLFDTSKISQTIQDVLQEVLSEQEQFSLDAMGANGGITCFAKLDILADGTLDMHNIQMSMVPWALGLSRKYGLMELDTDRFKQDCLMLKEKLIQLNQEYCVTSISEANETIVQYLLSPSILLKLINTLNQWAYDCPLIESNTPVIAICLKWRDKRNKEDSQNDSPKTHNNKNDDEEDDALTLVLLKRLKANWLSR